ncbi:MAG: S-layer homology domain-containing protein [Alkaliphilus sp.]
MKKIISITLLIIIVVTTNAWAFEIPGYEGGIQNEFKYKEMIFITGEPILMEGTVRVRRTERDGRRTERFTFSLENTEREAELSRSVNMEIEIKEENGQKIEVYTIRSFRETIEIDGIEFEADDETTQWSKSDVYQQKPGITFFTGNWDSRKLFTINETEGEVLVTTRGTVVGYDHFWGATNTQVIEHFIEYKKEGDAEMNWQGTVTVEVSHNRTKSYHYADNAPVHISFAGGFLLTEAQENVLKYTYDLPRLGENGEGNNQRNIGTNSLSLDTNPNIQRLIIPSMRDIGGHWAEDKIRFLASLGAINPDATHFGPSLPMTRGEFARAVAVVMGLVPKEDPSSRQRTISTTEEISFLDVSKGDVNYKYINIVNEKNIMTGRGEGQFFPNETLTKTEAAIIMVRLLGLKNLAPLPPYSTGFRDDAQIPVWAKDYVFVARDLGLINGTATNFFQPTKKISKAEAATMLTNLISYLQNDIKYDFREGILNY